MSAIATSRPAPEGLTPSSRFPTAPSYPVPGPLLLVGLASSLGDTPIEELERRSRAVRRAQLQAWFAQRPETEEVAVLSTCHRVELVLLARSRPDVEGWLRLLPGSPASWTVREGREEVHHLFRVAAGRESLAVGEVEVRHQIEAAARSIVSRHPRPVLSSVLSGAIRAAEQVAPAGPPAPSVARVAAAALLRLVDRAHPRVLVVGAGAVGNQVVGALTAAARVTWVFHREPPPEEFVRAMGARAVPYTELRRELELSDAVVTAVKVGQPCLTPSDIPRDRPVVLVDLGVPRNIDPMVRELPNVRLVDLEELHAAGRLPASGDDRDERVEALARRFSEDLEARLRETWAGAILSRAEEIRGSELANARRFLGTLTPEQEVAVERLTHRLVVSLLVPSVERLRSLPPGPEGERQARLALEVLRPLLDAP